VIVEKYMTHHQSAKGFPFNAEKISIEDGFNCLFGGPMTFLPDANDVTNITITVHAPIEIVNIK